MTKKLCELCGEHLATVPDRSRTGRPINRVCSRCHGLRLVGDMQAILELTVIKQQLAKTANKSPIGVSVTKIGPKELDTLVEEEDLRDD